MLEWRKIKYDLKRYGKVKKLYEEMKNKDYNHIEEIHKD